MALVASVDYVAKRIHLSAASVGVNLDTLDVYREVRALRVSTEAHRAYRPIIIGGGGIQKTATTFTQPYVQLLGSRIIPYDAAQYLVVTRETFTDDGQSGVGCFDRSGLSSVIDIDIQVSPVEVREVSSGSGPSAGAIADATVAAMNAAPPGVNVKKVNDTAIAGSGVPGSDPWRPA